MNLTDVYEEGLEVKNYLEGFDINKLRSIQKFITAWQLNINEFLMNNDIIGGSQTALNNSSKLGKSLNENYTSFIKKIRDLYLINDIINIAKYNVNLTYINCTEFNEKYLIMSEKIHDITACDSSKKETTLFNEVKEAINEVIEHYDLLQYKIKCITEIHDKLVNGNNCVRIRFMNENNKVEDLINNMTHVELIYDNINKLIGDRTVKLKYERIESGTLEVFFTGFMEVMPVIIPLLVLGYTVYSEQFSPMAKLERKEKEIKVRGDYLKLIKEYGSIDSIEDFNIEDSEEINTILADIEESIKNLFVNNPCISINGEKLGILDYKDGTIDIKLLESDNEKLNIERLLGDNDNKNENLE